MIGKKAGKNTDMEYRDLLCELESLVETLDILTDEEMLESIRKGEEDYRSGRYIVIEPEEVDEFFDCLISNCEE